MGNLILSALAVLTCFGISPERTQSPPVLLPADAEILVMNTPEVLKAKSRGACVEPDFDDLAANTAYFQVRNTCTKAPSGLIGNYSVDLNSGELWEGLEKRNDTAIDSPHLRALRAKLLKRARARKKGK